LKSVARRQRRRNLGAVGFLLPYFLLLSVFFLAPALSIIPMSMTRWSLVDAPQWVFLDNYRALFQDPFFIKALRNTIYYTVLVTFVLTTLGLLLALLLNQKLRGRILGRVAVIMPYVVSSAVAGILWKWIYDRNYGIINSYMRALHLPMVGWLSDAHVAMLSIVIMNSWWSIGFNTIIFLAALQGIPAELYEAARIDGAARFRSFWSITLPMLKPITLYATVLCAANSFQMFDESYIMTQGGPLGSTTTLVNRIYTLAFENFRFGDAAALSVIVLAIIIVLTVSQFAVAGRRKI
jgi:ABC-type sugar transport system permease subunit